MLLPPGAVRPGTAIERAAALAWIGDLSGAEQMLFRASPDEPATLWLTAFCASARGDFPRAATLAPRAAGAARGTPLRSAAALTAGAALRQMRRYEPARRMDLLALGEATHPWQRANALIGLAADAIGDADPDACARLLDQAEQVAGAGVRAAIRAGWVRCELGLLRSDARAAWGGARAALDHATASRARRHIAKSWLFLGVALEAAGDAQARAALAQAQRLAANVGARPLAVVAHDLLARIG